MALVPFVDGCERKTFTEQGVVGLFGGVGLAPGRFNYPRGIAVEGGARFAAPGGSAAVSGGSGVTTVEPDAVRAASISPCVFVVDKSGRIQRFSADGEYETSWRVPETQFGKPIGMAVHPDGRLFVADTHYHRVLIYDRDGRLLVSFGSEGSGDGQFQLPTDVAFDRRGFIYVSEYHLNDRITKWSPELQFVQSMGEQPIDGVRLSRPSGIVVDEEDTLWVADACNHRLVRFGLDGRVLTHFGSFGHEPGRMRYPYDVDVSHGGEIVVCEYEGARLQWFSKEGRSLRIWGRHGRKPGELFAPWGLAFGPSGRIYIVDSLNERIQIVQP
jgi:DNA-binding beta-propeller fold protein YncE